MPASTVFANRPQLENVRDIPRIPPSDANRADRTKRVKDAKAEAQKEIEEYRKKKQEEYKQFESEVSPAPLNRLYMLLTLGPAIEWQQRRRKRSEQGG